MPNIEDLVRGSKVLIKKGTTSVSEDLYFRRKFYEDIAGEVSMIFSEDNNLVGVNFVYERTHYTLNYRPEDLMKVGQENKTQT